MILGARKSKIKGAGRPSVWRGPTSWFVDVYLLIVSSYGGEQREASSVIIRTLIPLDQGPALMTSFNLKYLLVGPVSKYNHIRG